MTDLTEQWKKGELQSGWYWVDYYSVDGAVMLEYIPQHNGFGYEEKELVQAVLEPVPSYEEWQASYNCMLENEVLRLKNAQLKELMKEANNWIKAFYAYETSEFVRKQVKDCFDKINQVLGKDK